MSENKTTQSSKNFEDKKNTTHSSLSLGYCGKITMNLNSGNRVLFSRVYKNSGHDKLFEYLCKALAGIKDSNSMPYKIAFFNNTATNPPEKPTTSKTDLVSYLVSLNTSPEVATKRDSAGKDYWTTTLHFLIPYTYFINNIEVGSKEVKFNQLSLYSAEADSKNEVSLKNDLCAHFFLVKEEGGVEMWDTFTVNDNTRNNFNITVDWEMSFTNIAGGDR